MMPSWLEFVLTLIVVYATLFFLVWILDRDKLSRRARVLGWTAIAVVGASFLWSLGYEILLPYIRAGRESAALLTVLQPSVMLSGTVLLVYGAIRFLRSWRKLMMLEEQTLLPAISKYLVGDHPALERIRRQPTLRERFGLAGKLMLSVLMIPGLGLVFIGLGITIAGAQVLEPDPSIAPDVQLVAFAVILIFGGGVQEWWARRRG
jgi:hypothetical protein